MGSSPDNTMWCLYVNHVPTPKKKLRERTKNWPWDYSSGLGGSSHRNTKRNLVSRGISLSWQCRCFTRIVLFNSPNGPDRQVVLTLFFRRQNWVSEKLSNFLNCSIIWSHPPSSSPILNSWSDLSNYWLGFIFISVLDVWSACWKLGSTFVKKLFSRAHKTQPWIGLNGISRSRRSQQLSLRLLTAPPTPEKQ